MGRDMGHPRDIEKSVGHVLCQHWAAVLEMGQDNVHRQDVQDCLVYGHELCNIQDMLSYPFFDNEL